MEKEFSVKLILVASAPSVAKRKQCVAKAATELLSKTNFGYYMNTLAFFVKISPKRLTSPENTDFVVQAKQSRHQKG